MNIALDSGMDKDFLAALERGEHLRPFDGEIHPRDISVEEIRKITDRYPFTPV